MPSKAELLETYKAVQSWGEIAEALDLPARTVWRFATDPDYIPKRKDIRKKLGLPPYPEIYLIRQVRDPEGKFT